MMQNDSEHWTFTSHTYKASVNFEFSVFKERTSPHARRNAVPLQFFPWFCQQETSLPTNTSFLRVLQLLRFTTPHISTVVHLSRKAPLLHAISSVLSYISNSPYCNGPMGCNTFMSLSLCLQSARNKTSINTCLRVTFAPFAAQGGHVFVQHHCYALWPAKRKN